MQNPNDEIVDDELEAPEEIEQPESDPSEEVPEIAASLAAQEMEEEEDADEGQSESEEEIKGKHWSKDKILLDRIRRDNYRYAAEKNELQAMLQKKEDEISQLRYLNNVSMDASLANYEAAAKERLDRATELREAAYESGDVKAITATDIALSKAVYEFEKLQGYKNAEKTQAEMDRASQERIYNQQQQQYQQQQAQPFQLSEEAQMLSHEWANNNEWFKTNSPNYDPQRATLANQICDHLDNWCRANNSAHLIGSEQYLNSLDSYLSQYSPVQQRQGNPMTKAKPMQNSSHQQSPMVAPARGRAMGSTAGPMQTRNAAPKVNLSPFEADWAKKLGVSPDQYKAHKVKAIKNDPFSDQINQQRGR